MLLSILLIAVSLSIDALGVATAYGMKKISIPLASKLLMCFFSILYSSLALFAGKSLSFILPPLVSKLIGVFILGLMGIWIVIQALIKKDDESISAQNSGAQKRTVFEIAIKSLGLTIQIIKNPFCGDIDKSGTIDLGESLLLGLALSIDAIGAGLGSGLMGFYSILIPITIALFQLVFIYAGLFIGNRFSKYFPNKKIVSIISGALLILLAIIRI